MKTLSRISLSFLIMSSLAACGSGGGGSSKSTPPPVVPPVVEKPKPTTYPIKVTVSGLKGAITLGNGADVLTISANGNAAFSKSIEELSAYDVNITRQPTDQICSLKNGKKIMVANAPVVEVACSDGLATSLLISKPKDYSLKDLRVVSNYQSLGGASDAALLLSSTLKVYPNSFVALKSLIGDQILYLAYVTGTAGPLSVNSDSTALALLMLEPAVVDALNSHGKTASDLFAALYDTNKKPLPEIQKLSDEILKKANGGNALFDSSGTDFNPQLDQALALALVKISAMNILTVVDATQLSAGGTDIGLKERADKTGVDVTVKNRLPRTVSVGWNDDLKNATLLAQNETLVLGRAMDLTQKYNLAVGVSGPGVKDTAPTNISAFTSAIVRSVEVDYFAPGLLSLLGAGAANGQTVMNCLSAKTQANLDAAIIEGFAPIQDLLQTKNYFKAYGLAANLLRSKFITNNNLDEILACNNLGLSGLTTDEKANAKIQLGALISGWSKLRSNTNLSVDLFANSQQSYFVNALQATSAYSIWQKSNAFELNVNVPAQVTDETEYEFSASCADGVVCSEFAWDFGAGPILRGPSVKYTFSKIGDQVIKVTATGSSGFKVTKDIQLTVSRSGSQVNLQSKTTNTPLGSTAVDMGSVSVGTALSYTFTITNSGRKDLQVTEISSSDPGFEIIAQPLPASPDSIKAASSKDYTVKFKPGAMKQYSAVITVKTNDQYLPSTTFAMKGEGILAVGEGRYETTDKATGTTTTRDWLHDVTTPVVSDKNNYPQVRLFASQQQLNMWPQLIIKVPNYSGLGRYSLDNDTVNGERLNCHGLLKQSESFADTYCTDSDKKASGSVVVDAVASDSESLRLDYDFEAVNCISGTLPNCVKNTIRVRGSVTVTKSSLKIAP